MDKIIPEIFEIEVGDRVYRIEFNREGLKEADRMGVLENAATAIVTDKPTIILYAGLKMHKPDVTFNLAKKIWEQMQDEGWTFEQFQETIGEEFNRCFKAFFMGKGNGKIVALSKVQKSTK